MILSWQENMTKEDSPPPGIWQSEDALKEWFEMLEVRRETKQTDVDITGWEQPDEDESVENELIHQYRRRMGLK